MQRRAQDGHGLTRPELAVLLATAKLALQDAIEAAPVATDPALIPELTAAFPRAMRVEHRAAIERHQLRGDIVATKLANRIVNRLGIVHPYELAEEEGASLGDVATAFVTAEALFDVAALWAAVDDAAIDEGARLLVFEQVAIEMRAAMADLLRGAVTGRGVGATIDALRPGIDRLGSQVDALLVNETRMQAQGFAARLTVAGVPDALVARVVRLAELDGAVGIAALAGRTGIDVAAVTRAFTTLGGALGLDWAQGAAMQAAPTDPWDRLLVAGLGRDFQQMRLDFLGEDPHDLEDRVAAWIVAQAPRVADYRRLVDRARITAMPTPAMLAQLAGQARVLLARR